MIAPPPLMMALAHLLMMALAHLHLMMDLVQDLLVHQLHEEGTEQQQDYSMK